ncbi:MAG: hypothetical protein WCW31_00760 [Patescibacteria group bacterium]|jgi:hypothetical protein
MEDTSASNTASCKIDLVRLEKAKANAKAIYAAHSKVSCPYLHEQVHFNNEGFEHLLTRTWNRGRSSVEQYTRLRLLPKAIEVIEKSHLIQEYKESQTIVRVNSNSSWSKRLKQVIYYVFIAVYPQSGLRIKVIVKQVEGGKPFFWSVYPSWRVEKDGAGNDRKVFYSGNLEVD